MDPPPMSASRQDGPGGPAVPVPGGQKRQPGLLLRVHVVDANAGAGLDLRQDRITINSVT
jgi:hypothetical protein